MKQPRYHGVRPPFSTGAIVRLKRDPRHVGRVNACFPDAVRVQWDETGWKSDERASDLERTTREHNEI